ncbi:MAG: 2-amino-4-hydroxy-6-hydroxymethyldihydropteridine diphosphokinase [Ginsengibacter sp.]
MNHIYILTGGNLGNKMANLKKATQILENEVGQIVKSSSIYKTAAWGNTDQPDFYNQVHIIKTSLAPDQLMETILQIEETMGRVRTKKNAARIIDIDILFYNDEIINEPGLTIPHPEIPNRRFVLEPLNEIAPDFVHPSLKKKITELLHTSTDTLKVTPVKVS